MVRVYCDFDGTVCTDDVGNHLFRTFAGEEQAVAIVKDYLEDRITARECLRREAAAVTSITMDAFERFITQFNVDAGFAAFADFCDERGIPMMVVSDGLDAYVGRILARHGLERIPFAANHAEIVTDGSRSRLEVSFPFSDAECDLCGNCKRNHMLTTSGEEDVLVYVGDGISDRCPVRYADIVFAKRRLIQYCQQQNITYFEFSTFADVQERMAGLLGRKRIKHRREAVMARRDVYLQG